MTATIATDFQRFTKQVGFQDRSSILENLLSTNCQDILLANFISALDKRLAAKNSEHFVETLQQHNISDRDISVSFDVERLFTDVPINEVLAIIKKLAPAEL